MCFRMVVRSSGESRWSYQNAVSSGKCTASWFYIGWPALETLYFSAHLISDRRYLISCVIVAIAENSFLFVLLW